MNILILGSGGREHALAWRMEQDSTSSKIFVWPGNDGMVSGKTSVVKTKYSDAEFTQFLKTEKIDLVVPGSEQFLYDGIADICQELKVPCFGPKQNASLLEKSKLFSKNLMKKAGVPTSRFVDLKNLNDLSSAYAELKTFTKPVIKISGPSLGKGVFVCENNEEATEVLRKLHESPQPGMEDGLLVEEGVSGKEVSMFFACTGTKFTYLGSAQDHKRVFDGDKGPNTGGMGAVSPVPWVDEKFIADITERFVVPTLQTMESERNSFKGILFLGLMVDGSDINLLEYNVRFGDPETQTLLPLIEGDFTSFLLGFAQDKLTAPLKIKNKTSVHVVKAAAGYPGTFGSPIEKGQVINVEGSEWADAKVFFAGVKSDNNGKLITNGGRVLGLTTWGDSFTLVRQNCYEHLKQVSFNGEHYRKDIGKNL